MRARTTRQSEWTQRSFSHQGNKAKAGASRKNPERLTNYGHQPFSSPVVYRNASRDSSYGAPLHGKVSSEPCAVCLRATTNPERRRKRQEHLRRNSRWSPILHTRVFYLPLRSSPWGAEKEAPVENWPRGDLAQGACLAHDFHHPTRGDALWLRHEKLSLFRDDVAVFYRDGNRLFRHRHAASHPGPP